MQKQKVKSFYVLQPGKHNLVVTLTIFRNYMKDFVDIIKRVTITLEKA